MQLGKYMGNDISSDDTHSNEYAAGTVSGQSFQERQEIEKNRQTVGAYQHSRIGQNFAPRGEYVRSKPRPFKKVERHATRQELNANGGAPHLGSSQQTVHPGPERPTAPRQQFREPPSRGYNPYG